MGDPAGASDLRNAPRTNSHPSVTDFPTAAVALRTAALVCLLARPGAPLSFSSFFENSSRLFDILLKFLIATGSGRTPILGVRPGLIGISLRSPRMFRTSLPLGSPRAPLPTESKVSLPEFEDPRRLLDPLLLDPPHEDTELPVLSAVDNAPDEPLPPAFAGLPPLRPEISLSRGGGPEDTSVDALSMPGRGPIL